MTYVVTYRYAIGDEKVADEQVAIARSAWLKQGRNAYAAMEFGSGPNIGQWIIAVEFPDAQTYGRAQDVVRQSSEFKSWTAANRAARNVSIVRRAAKAAQITSSCGPKRSSPPR